MRVVLDAGGQEGPLAKDLLRNVAILSPNETELARMTGMPTDTEGQIVEAARALQALGVSTVLVKLGADGAMLVDAQGGVTRVPAFKVANVVDTTGAGDCFTASFCVGLLEGRSYSDAMRFAGMRQLFVVADVSITCVCYSGGCGGVRAAQGCHTELAHATRGGRAAPLRPMQAGIVVIGKWCTVV